MNNYPIWWDSTITLYNRFEDPITQLVTWYKTIIPGCYWDNLHDKVKIGEAVLETNSVICRVRKSEKYVDAETWLLMPEDIKGNYFTISQQDIVVLGEVNEEIDEYHSGTRSTDLLAKYKKLQRCFEISAFVNNTGLGRGNEHYFLRGL